MTNLTNLTYYTRMVNKQTDVRRKNPDLDIRFVRARLIERGDSLNAWSLRNCFTPMHVTRSLRGDYFGPKARTVVKMIRGELGL